MHFNKSVRKLVKPMYVLHQVYSRGLGILMQSLIAGITLFMEQGSDLGGDQGKGQREIELQGGVEWSSQRDRMELPQAGCNNTQDTELRMSLMR